MSKPRSKKKIVTAGLVAGLLAGAGAGLVLEVSGSAGAEQSVTAAGASTDAAAADPASQLQSILQPLVDDGTLTQAQADAVIAALEAAGPMGMGGDFDGDGRGGHHGGRGGDFGGAHIEGLGPDALSLAADTIGISEDELRTAVEGGQTIADVAAANGSSADAVIAALVEAAKAHIDSDVAEGEYTQDEADTRLADATTAITDFVNNTPPTPMGGDFDGDGPSDDTATTAPGA
ncbi:MAG: hypothetical protein ACO3C1_06585 [Ilumatobacteraceae bacterium]